MIAASVHRVPFVNLRDAATMSSYFYCGLLETVLCESQILNHTLLKFNYMHLTVW